MGWVTRMGAFLLASMSDSCIMQAGQDVATVVHPVSMI